MNKMWTSILIADLLILQITNGIHVGVGISDITGPAGETPMVTFIELPNTYLRTRCLMVSTDQADPSCFYFRISRILMERP